MTKFDYPEVTLCGWQDVKIQLLTKFSQKYDALWVVCQPSGFQSEVV